MIICNFRIFYPRQVFASTSNSLELKHIAYQNRLIKEQDNTIKLRYTQETRPTRVNWPSTSVVKGPPESPINSHFVKIIQFKGV